MNRSGMIAVPHSLCLKLADGKNELTVGAIAELISSLGKMGYSSLPL
jgi:hypothetical protein